MSCRFKSDSIRKANRVRVEAAFLFFRKGGLIMQIGALLQKTLSVMRAWFDGNQFGFIELEETATGV